MKPYKISIVLVILIYMLSGCGTTHIETQTADSKGALPRCFCLEGKLYFFYGACVIDGEQIYIQIDEKWYETISEETVKKMSEEASKKASLEAE